MRTRIQPLLVCCQVVPRGAEESVYVQHLFAVVAEVQRLLVPVVHEQVVVGAVEEQDNVVGAHSLVA